MVGAMMEPGGQHMRFDFDPRKIPETYILAVGKVSINWTQTENIIDDAIAGVARLNSMHGWAITAHMNFPMKCDALMSLAELLLNGEDHESLRLTIARVKILAESRNRYVHGYWATHEDTGAVYLTAIKARGKLKADYTTVALADIEATAASIYKAGMDIMNFLMLRDLLPLAGR
jgi:hypothetical protein